MGILLAILALEQARPAPLREAFAAADRDCASLAFSPDGKHLAVGGVRSVRIFAVRDDTLEELRGLAPQGRVDELHYGRWLVTRSRDQDARVWDPAAGAPLKVALEQGFASPGAAVSPLGQDWLVLAERGRGLRFWRMDGLGAKRRFLLEVETRECAGVALGHVTAAAWADGTLLAGDDQGFLHVASASRILSIPSPDPRFAPVVPKSAAAANLFRPHLGEIASIAPSGDGKLCVTAGLDGRVRLWPVSKLPSGPRPRGAEAPKPAWEIAGHAAELSASGALLAVSEAGGVSVYHAATGAAVSWNPLRGRAVRLRFGPDGKVLAAIVCRCADCVPGEKVDAISARKRLADHGGTLVVFR